MKKILFLTLLLTLGLFLQSQAANTNSEKEIQAKKNTIQTQESKTNTVQTKEQNKAINQGENTQAQIQEQSLIQTQNNEKSDKESKSPGEQNRSQVANAVQEILQVADRNGGIGQQVRIIAQNQNQNQIELEKNVEQIQNRGAIAKFFIGPDYGGIANTQKLLEQTREQIRQLNQIMTQLSNKGDQQQLTEQIQVLERANQEIENIISDAQKGFSLFGWLNKILS